MGACVRGYSPHLRDSLLFGTIELPVEGVRFGEIRRMLPWWWPAGEAEVIVCADVARRFLLKPGDRLELSGDDADLCRLQFRGGTPAV